MATAPLLFVALSLDVGGAERHLSSLLPELVRRGWPVSIYCMNRLGAFAEGVRAGGVDVIGPPIERVAGPQSTVRRLWATGRAGGRLMGVMRRKRPKIVHFFLPEPYVIGAPMALLSGIPIRVMSRRGLNLYQRNWPGVRHLEQRLHPRMSAVLANSKRVADDLLAEGCRADQLGIIYNGVVLDGSEQTANRDEMRQSLGIGQDATLGVVVANLIGYKGHADILHGLARVRDRMPRPWTVLCVGRDEGVLSDLEAMRQSLGLDEHVRFLGVRNDVAALLRSADFSVLASHEEGFSNAVIEAMAAGLPQVVTDVGGNAEAVGDGVHGFVVPPREPGQLGEAILKLALDPAGRERLGLAAKRQAQERFSLDACIDRYELVYRALLQGRRVGDLPLV